MGVLTEVTHGDVLPRKGRLLERKACSQGLDIGEGAGPERFFDGVGDFRFAAVFVGQGKEIDGETARVTSHYISGNRAFLFHIISDINAMIRRSAAP